MTDYLKPTFTVSVGASQEYRDNWERTFTGRFPICHVCGECTTITCADCRRPACARCTAPAWEEGHPETCPPCFDPGSDQP